MENNNIMEYTISNKLAALKPSAIREIFKSLSDPTIISFAAGNPSPASFPAEELAERDALRKEYIEGYRRSLVAHLENVYVVDEKGNETKLSKKKS